MHWWKLQVGRLEGRNLCCSLRCYVMVTFLALGLGEARVLFVHIQKICLIVTKMLGQTQSWAHGYLGAETAGDNLAVGLYYFNSPQSLICFVCFYQSINHTEYLTRFRYFWGGEETTFFFLCVNKIPLCKYHF